MLCLWSPLSPLSPLSHGSPRRTPRAHPPRCRFTADSLQSPESGHAPVWDLDYVAAALEANAKKSADNQAKTERLQREHRECQAEREAVQAQIDAIRAPDHSRVSTRHDVTVSVTANAAGRASLQLMYLLTHAKWEPSYGASAVPPRPPRLCVCRPFRPRLTCAIVAPTPRRLRRRSHPGPDVRIDSGGAMTLTYFGMITQSTGLDWNDTRVVRPATSIVPICTSSTSRLFRHRHVARPARPARPRFCQPRRRQSAAPRRSFPPRRRA